MRKWVFLYFMMLFASLLVYNPNSIQAAQQYQQVKLMINGTIEVPEVPATITSGRTLVPLRFISEKMGAHVEWFPQTKEIKIYKDERLLELQLGSIEIKVNGTVEKMDIAPHLEKERTLVPIRFVSKYLGLNVGWEEVERVVIVSEPVHVYVDGIPLTGENSTLKYNQQIYLPIFKLADMLNIEVKKETESNTYAFIQQSKNQKAIENTIHISAATIGQLPASEIIIIDGVKMAPFEWIDPVLGTFSKWDLEKNIVYISKVKDKVEDNEQIEESDRAENIPQLLDFMVEQNMFRFEFSHEYIKPTHFFLENPHRLVVDVPHTLLAVNLMPSPGLGANVISVDHEVVEQVRISQFSSSPYTIRLVFDLKQRSDVSLKQVDKQLQILIEKRRPLIVVDAGHGGSDPGALGKYSTEKEVSLAVALKLLHLLENDADLKVMATRVDDSYPTLDDRVYLANQNNADLFISVHANAFKNTAIGGTESYIYFNVDNTFGKIVHKHVIEATGLLDRGLKEANFKVIRETKMPAVLIEMAFISNAYEEQLLNDPVFQDKVAWALYNAIKEYELGK